MKLTTRNIADKIVALSEFGKVNVVEPEINSDDEYLKEWHVILNHKEKDEMICDGDGKTLQEALDGCIERYNRHAMFLYCIET